MIAYKLTDQHRKTHNGCLWTPGEWKETSGDGELCGPGWLHFYTHPLLAVLLNPIHANFADPRLWIAEVDPYKPILGDRGMKFGSSRARIVEEIPLPVVTKEQRIRFAIYCAREVYKDPKWLAWADGWLSGKDRSRSAAAAAAAAAADDAYAAYAADAAYAAAAAAADDAYAADAASYAAYARSGKPICLITLAESAIRDEVTP